MKLTFKIDMLPDGAFFTMPCFVKFKTNAESIADIIQQQNDGTLEHEVVDVSPCDEDEYHDDIDFNSVVSHDRADIWLQVIFDKMAKQNVIPEIYEQARKNG